MDNKQGVAFLKWFIKRFILLSAIMAVIYFFLNGSSSFLYFYVYLVLIGGVFALAIIIRAILVFLLGVNPVPTTRSLPPDGFFGGWGWLTAEELYVFGIIFGIFLVAVPGGAVLGIPALIIFIALLVGKVIKRIKTEGKVYFIYVIPLKK